MKIEKWIEENTKSLKGKTVVITGSTGGLGKAIVKHLTSLGANFILCNRDIKKSEAQKQEILENSPNSIVKILSLDLSNFESVNDTLKVLEKEKFDFFILNSGVYNVKRFETSLGFDNIFQINFLMPYYMVNKLIKKIKNEKIKVIAMGSIAHNYSKLNEDDVQFLNVKKSSKAYGNSKRFLMFSLFELAEKEKVDIVICHPGVTLTNMTNHYPKAINWFVKFGIRLVFPSPQKASLSVIKALFSRTKKNEWVGPSIFNIWGYPKKSFLKTCTQEESLKIFEISEKLYKKIDNKK